MDLGPYWLNLENFNALAGLEEKLDQAWSQHGPYMVSKHKNSIDIGLRPCWLSLEKFSALAGLEVKLGQTWPQHGPDIVSKIGQTLRDIGLRPCWLSLENFSAIAGWEVKVGQTWPQHGPSMALIWCQRVYTPWTLVLDHVYSAFKISEL